MTLGKTITLYLMDGEPSGRWQAQLALWNATAYKIPRAMLPDCDDMDYIHETIFDYPKTVLNHFIAKIETNSKKYENAFIDIESDIHKNEKELCAMLGALNCDESDVMGIKELKKLLRGK